MTRRSLFSLAALPAAAGVSGGDRRSTLDKDQPAATRGESGKRHAENTTPAPPRPRRILFLVDPARIDVDAMCSPQAGSTLDDFDVVLIPAFDLDPPLQVFDLDGLAAPDSGQLQAIVAEAIAAPGLAQERERCAQVAEQTAIEHLNMLRGYGCSCGHCIGSRAIASRIRTLAPATPATQAEDAALMALAADQARKHGHSTVRIRRGHDGALQLEILSYDTYWP